MQFSNTWIVGLTTLLATAGIAAGCSSDDPICYGTDTTHEIGATFDDGCRECTCNADTTITCVATSACDTGCEDSDGNAHDLGAFWPAGDGCNVCQCVSAGEVSCTENQCGVSCVYDGQQHPSGSTFPAIDGCNECTCEADGTVGCTEMACTCNPSAEWYRFYAGTSPAECAVINYTCPDNTTTFANDCGCGCEQSATCEQTYDCTPPNTCDTTQIAEDCPYSEILE